MSEKLSVETIAERFARLGHGKNYAAALAFLRIPARYIDMGQACERHGLARFADDGEMLFQAPDDVIAENAVAAYNAARAEARPAVDREAVALLACRFMNDSGLDWPEASCRDQLTYIDKPHDGDCTKKPYTCLRCCAEDAYRFADAILALLSPATSPGEGSSGGRVQAAPDGATEAQHSAGGGKIPGVEEVIRYLRNYGPGTPDTTDMYFMRWAADHLCNLVSREAFWRSQAQTSEAG